MGPAAGPAVSVPCALSGSLRSVYLWFVLGGLLLGRRANRTKAAWAVVLPLAWCGQVCFTLGMISVMVLMGTELLIDWTQLGNRQSQVYFFSGALVEIFLAPYFVFFWFVLLALLSPFYRRRLTTCFVGEALPAQGD